MEQGSIFYRSRKVFIIYWCKMLVNCKISYTFTGSTLINQSCSMTGIFGVDWALHLIKLIVLNLVGQFRLATKIYSLLYETNTYSIPQKKVEAKI